MHPTQNKLALETSPYLLQHAGNPVNWFPWGSEALNNAKEQDKPILLSIGYSACHWCHVMEKESFENTEIAAIMNEHFINIKVDREERPDLDHIYMDALQTITGSGGWPLNIFLTPDAKPFYGGTYFPPIKTHHHPSWADVLLGVATAFKDKRTDIEAQADSLTNHLFQSNSFGQQTSNNVAEIFDETAIHTIAENVVKSLDKEWGGFGYAPKFPQTFSIQFLLRYYYLTNNESYLQYALLCIDKMIAGGIYDQIGGGFARYSTDREWLAPHFEKMLYDNALLISLISEAYQITKKERYKEVIEETITFLQREMKLETTGFFSAIDADSEGVEGKFYVWTYDEVMATVKMQASIFCDYYNITPDGNWEHVNIPRVLINKTNFAAAKNIEESQLNSIIEKGKQDLLQSRSKRQRPLLDDKILLNWNALLITALCKAFAATGNEGYKNLANSTADFIIEKMKQPSSKEFFHTWKNEKGKHAAFLDDYAYFIQALIALQEISANTSRLVLAMDLMTIADEAFSELQTGFYYFTADKQADIIVRKKEIVDSAVPSGNAVMACNLHQLGLIFDKPEWRNRAQNMLASVSNACIKHPTSFGVWTVLALELYMGTNEISIVGEQYLGKLNEVLAEYIPHRVLIASATVSDIPLIKDKNFNKHTNVWLCKKSSCQAPVSSAFELISLINNLQGKEDIFFSKQ